MLSAGLRGHKGDSNRVPSPRESRSPIEQTGKHTVLGQDMTPAVVKGLCPRNGECGEWVLEGLELGQTQKVKGQEQQGTLLSLESRISPPGQVWALDCWRPGSSRTSFSNFCKSQDSKFVYEL